jgi:hypothetical protein
VFPDPAPPLREECPSSVAEPIPAAERDAGGWVRRNLADPARARETVEAYESLGFEVRLEPLSPDDFGPECESCALTACRSFVMVYTRKPGKDDRATE